jgi:diacylglycerol kinase (ATP)
MRKYIFIVNPNAGRKQALELMDCISEFFPGSIDHEIVVWKDKHGFLEIKNKILDGQYSHAVAVGGDGTVNEVANAIRGTEIVLGIIPAGSGNGLARTLGISMHVPQALKEMITSRSIMMDCGEVNGHAFFCTSGTGFDALIGERFAKSQRRGLMSYIRIVISELFKYRATNCTLVIEGKTLERRAFLITVANAGQYGNDFFIAPEASITDGNFQIVVLKPFNFFAAFAIAYKFISKNAHTSRYTETFVASKLKIIRSDPGPIHFDGEPGDEIPELEYQLVPRALRVVTGENYKPSPDLV